MANKKEENPYKIISVRKLSESSGINYSKIYANMINRYENNTLTDMEKTKLCNALYAELEALSTFLGVKIILKRL